MERSRFEMDRLYRRAVQSGYDGDIADLLEEEAEQEAAQEERLRQREECSVAVYATGALMVLVLVGWLLLLPEVPR